MNSQFQSYQLVLKVHKKINIEVGKLGAFIFPAGYYIYTGSAKKNMEARIQRHLKKDKSLHWHIDYLTSHKEIEIVDVRRSDMEECLLNEQTHGYIVVPGLGASDCRSKCGSHLKMISAPS